MKKTLTIVFLIAMTISQTVLFAQETKPAPQPNEKEMAAWMAYMTPGKYHTFLAQTNGMWNTEITMWMEPGATPTTSKGTCENSMILGGRYQESVHKNEWNGAPFEGKATVGFDNILKKYQSTWIDNMGTGMMIMEGVYNDKTKTLMTTGKMVDPMAGTVISVREVMTFMDENTYAMDMYITNKGKEFKTMNIKYTRVR